MPHGPAGGGVPNSTNRDGTVKPASTTITPVVHVQRAAPGSGRLSENDKSQIEFDSLVLQTMLAAILPKESEKIFGTGSAGQMWKSLLIEKIADEVARSGRICLFSPQHFAGSAIMSTPTGDSGSDVQVSGHGISPGWDATVEAAHSTTNEATDFIEKLGPNLSSWLWQSGEEPDK